MATAKRRSAGEAITPTISWFASLTGLRVVIYLGFWKSGKSDGCAFCSMLARRQELNAVANQRPQPGARFSRLGPARLGDIDRWSLALDFKILLGTIPAVILGLGAVLYIEQRISDSTVVQS